MAWPGSRVIDVMASSRLSVNQNVAEFSLALRFFQAIQAPTIRMRAIRIGPTNLGNEDPRRILTSGGIA